MVILRLMYLSITARPIPKEANLIHYLSGIVMGIPIILFLAIMMYFRDEVLSTEFIVGTYILYVIFAVYSFKKGEDRGVWLTVSFGIWVPILVPVFYLLYLPAILLYTYLETYFKEIKIFITLPYSLLLGYILYSKRKYLKYLDKKYNNFKRYLDNKLTILSSSKLRDTIRKILCDSKFRMPCFITSAFSSSLFDPDSPGWWMNETSGGGLPLLAARWIPITTANWIPYYQDISSLEVKTQENLILSSAALPYGIVPPVIPLCQHS